MPLLAFQGMYCSITVPSDTSNVIYSTGLAGLINTIQMYTRPAIVAAILGTVSTVGFTLQGVGLAYFYRQVPKTLSPVSRYI